VWAADARWLLFQRDGYAQIRVGGITDFLGGSIWFQPRLSMAAGWRSDSIKVGAFAILFTQRTCSSTVASQSQGVELQ